MSSLNPIAPIIVGVTAILCFAIAGRLLARKSKQPPVLGELVMGIIIGNLGYYFGVELVIIIREGPGIFDIVSLNLSGDSLEAAAHDTISGLNADRIINILHGPHGYDYVQVAHIVDIFSRYGVIFLLFIIGLDTQLNDLREVGGSSFRVAIIGIIMPFILGFWAVRIANPQLSFHTDLFVAAALCATSVGISARVLKDLNQAKSQTAHIILGASVLDDIFGLVMMAIVSGIIVSGEVSYFQIAWVLVSAVVFLAGIFWLSPYILRFTIKLVKNLNLIEAKIFISLLFVMALAWFSSLMGLATIVGAFAAGLILHEEYFVQWGAIHKHRFSIKDLMNPLELILVPIFFILMGMQVKIEAFFDWQVLYMTVALLIAALVGKLASGLGASKTQNRLAIGVGMIPRGEVGLVFASIGMSLHVVDEALFGAIVLMVIVTTLVAPVALKKVLSHYK